MKRTLIWIVGLSAAALSVMAAKWVETNPNSPVVTNRVVRVVEGGLQGDAWVGRSNVIVHSGSPADTWNGVLPTNGTFLDWKVVSNVVVELTVADRNAISNANFQASEAARLARQTEAKTNAPLTLEDFGEMGRLFRADVELTVNELNIVRAELTLLRMELNKAKANITTWRAEPVFATNTFAPRTLIQAKTAIKNNIEAQPDTAP